MISKTNTALIILLLLVSIISYSQTTILQYPNYPIKPNAKYFKSYLTVSKKIITGPAHWNKKQWIIAGSIITVGTAMYLFDDEIRKFIRKNQNSTLDNASKYIFEPWGGGIYPAILFGSYYLYGLTSKNLKARQIALGGTQVFFMAAISTQILKHVFHRHRPIDTDPSNPYLWDGPFKGWQNTSFPSRHTTIAFALASFMQSIYSDKLWIGILSYGFAAGVGLSRVYENEHWPSDVLIGAALGYAIGQTVYRVMSKDSKFSLGISGHGGIKLAYTIK